MKVKANEDDIRIFSPRADDVNDGDLFMAEVDYIEGHKRVTLKKV